MLTGSNGFIGNEIFKFCDSKNTRIVRIVSKLSDKDNAKDIYHWEDEWNFETSDYNVVVIHSAAESSFLNKDKRAIFSANVDRTRKIALWSEKNQAKFIFLSTIGVFDRGIFQKVNGGLDQFSKRVPRSIYGASKKLAEDCIFNIEGLNYIIFRIPWVYGSDMRRNSHIRAFHDWKTKGKLLSKIKWPGNVTVIHVTELAKMVHKYALNSQRKGILQVGETTKIPMSTIVSSRNALELRYLDKILKICCPILPFKLRILLEDALVYESPENLGIHHFENEFEAIMKSWEE